MAEDATAAGVYMGLVKNADPMGAYAAGVQLRSNLQRVDLAAQAQTSTGILELLQLQNQQAEQRKKNELAQQQLAIATFNAETQRINALKPRAGTTTMNGGVNPLAGIRWENNQWVFDPSAAGGGGGTAGGGAQPTYQDQGAEPLIEATATARGNGAAGAQPTGRVPEPSPEPGPQQPQQAQQGQKLPPLVGAQLWREGGPTLGQPNSGMSLPVMTNPGEKRTYGDQAANAPIMPGVGAAQPQGGGGIPLTGITMNSRGTVTVSGKPTDPKDIPGRQLTRGDLDNATNAVAHLNMHAVPTEGDTREGVTKFRFVDNEKGADFSISSLGEKMSKELTDEAVEIGGLVRSVYADPTNAEKMRAEGIVFPGDAEGREPTEEELKKGAGEMVTQGKDWNRGYANAKIAKQNAILEKAAKHADKLNAQFAGKGNYQAIGALDVLARMGFGMQSQPQQQGTAAVVAADGTGIPGSTQVVAGKKTVDGTTAVAAATDRVPTANWAVGLPGHVVSPYSGEGKELDVSDFKPGDVVIDPYTKQKFRIPQKEDTSKVTGTSGGSPDPSAPPTSPAAPPEEPERSPSGFVVKKKVEVPKQPWEIKWQKNMDQWEEQKKKVIKDLTDTVDDAEYALIKGGEQDLMGDPNMPQEVQPKSAAVFRDKWIKDYADKMKIKPLDGGKLTAESVIFVDQSGRSIKFREIVDAAIEDDERLLNLPEVRKQQQLKTKREGLSEAEKVLLR